MKVTLLAKLFGVMKGLAKTSEFFQIGEMDRHSFAFGAFVFDGRRNLLLKNGSPVVLSQRALSLLSALLSSGGKAVSKSDLMDAAWPSEFVEESNLTVQISALRKCLGRSPSGDDWIATVQRSGYQFVDPNRHPQLHLPPIAFAKTTPNSVAVLPFAVMGGEEEHVFFADGLAEDLITDLSKVQGLLVIARHSSFRFRGAEFTEIAAAAELGVRYIVSGKVRRSAERVRINIQLVDTERNGPAWAERFDGDLDDVFTLQDLITSRVVAAIRGTLIHSKMPQRYHSPSVEAYDLVVKSRRLPDQSFAANREALVNFKRAIALDPNYPEAHWSVAVTQLLWWCLWNGDMAESRQTSLAFAQRAIQLAPEDATANEVMGFVYMKLDRSEESKVFYDRALAIDPNNATTYSALCDLYMNWGMIKEALDAITNAIRLNPFPPGWFYDHLGRAQILDGDYANAITFLSRVETYGTFSGNFLATALALAGRMDEAKEETKSFLQRLPHWTISRWVANEFIRDKKTEQFWIEAFRRADLPE
jgi:TolB-like protein